MRAVRLLCPWPLAVLLATTAVAPRSEPAEPIPAPLAHSALITLEGAAVPGALILQVRANAGSTPVAVSDFSVAIDGKDVPVTARADGGWRVTLPGGPAGAASRINVAVTHDGIRELLSAKMPAVAAAPNTEAAPGGGPFGVHKQIVWWVLNIAIVLIAALAISRRMS